MQSQQINAENNSSHRNVIAMQSWHKQIKPTEHDVLWKCMKNNWPAEKTLASSVLSERLEKRDFGWFYLASKWCLFWPALCSFTNFDELASEQWWYFLNFRQFFASKRTNGHIEIEEFSLAKLGCVQHSIVQIQQQPFQIEIEIEIEHPLYVYCICVHLFHIHNMQLVENPQQAFFFVVKNEDAATHKTTTHKERGLFQFI